MRSGRLRHRITIQEKNPRQNEFLEELPGWRDIDNGTVWASVEPLRGREFLEAQREGAELTTRIRIRHRDGITPAMRVKYGDRTLDIISVIPINERNREIHLICREVVT